MIFCIDNMVTIVLTYMSINIFNQCYFISSISFLHHIEKKLLNSVKCDAGMIFKDYNNVKEIIGAL